MMRTSLTILSLALLSGCASTHEIEPNPASAAVDFAKAKVVEVTLSNFEFTPSVIDLQAGTPYVLKIVNRASGGHNFTAPEFFAAAKVAPEDAAQIAGGQIEVKGGETATIGLVPGTGTYKLVCTHFGHATLGMTGKIVVH